MSETENERPQERPDGREDLELVECVNTLRGIRSLGIVRERDHDVLDRLIDAMDRKCEGGYHCHDRIPLLLDLAEKEFDGYVFVAILHDDRADGKRELAFVANEHNDKKRVLRKNIVSAVRGWAEAQQDEQAKE